jgi:hypothetical protein
MFLIISCSDEVLKIRCYNDLDKTFNIEKDFIEKLDGFYVTKTEEQDEKNEKYLIKITTYQFKSKKPYRIDEKGNWFYNWSLIIEIYNSYQSAVHSFNNNVKKMNELYEIDPILLKGINNRTIIIDDTLYILKATCQEGRHVEEWFKKMLSVIFKNKYPEKHTIIRNNCGGSFGIQ